MSDIEGPRTPTPTSRYSETMDSQLSNAYHSPLETQPADMTPPPSTQIFKPPYKAQAQSSGKTSQAHLATPPATLKIGTNSDYSLRSGTIPTLDQARDLSESQLRDLVSELLPHVGEMRMAAAHAKLQHNLLSIEIGEVAQRAAVEHEMMRRELAVLQASSPLLRNRIPPSTAASPQARGRGASEAALRQIHALETDNLLLHRRLKQAKKVIKHLDGRNVRLEEANDLLRQRIKQNRDHVDAMRLSGTLSLENTPRSIQNTPLQRVKSTNPTGAHREAEDPFHALLFAARVSSGETNSVPSTPTHPRMVKPHHFHTRGTHSLSSLPQTPVRSRPMTADEALSTPVNRLIPTSHLSFSAPAAQFVGQEEDDIRYTDRDSTISASDQEEAYTDEDVPASQASQAATSMLRDYSGPVADRSQPAKAAEEVSLVQSKLVGKVVKLGHSTFGAQKKRGLAYDDLEDERRSKKAKMSAKPERMGLGIGVWSSPGV